MDEQVCGNSQLSNIGIDKPALNYLRSFIQKNCDKNTYIMITDSHKSIFNITNMVQVNHQPVTIINVDFHHDCYGDSQKSEVDCGNWVTQLFVNNKNKLSMNLVESKYFWVKRVDSDELEEPYYWKQSLLIDDLKEFGEFTIDVLFICRSGVWSPPHLDKEFIKFAKWCRLRNKNLSLTENNILISRYSKDFQNSVNQLKEQMDKFKRVSET